MDTTLGPYRPYGTMKNTSQKETGRLSLISTWRSPVAGRTFYDTRQSLELDVKLREPGWGPKLLPLLKASSEGVAPCTCASTHGCWQGQGIASFPVTSCAQNMATLLVFIAPIFRCCLQAGDPSGTGFCSKQHLLHTCMLNNILLTPGEVHCLIAEWQVMDHITGEVRCGKGTWQGSRCVRCPGDRVSAPAGCCSCKQQL